MEIPPSESFCVKVFRNASRELVAVSMAAESVRPIDRFVFVFDTFSASPSITIRLCVTDCTGAVFFTDLMLQTGSIATGWVGHVCEIQWTMGG